MCVLKQGNSGDVIVFMCYYNTFLDMDIKTMIRKTSYI